MSIRINAFAAATAVLFFPTSGSSQTRQTVPRITEVTVHCLSADAPGLVVLAEGELPSGGFTDVRLDPLVLIAPPADGYQPYRLSARTPEGDFTTTQIDQVSASHVWPDYQREAPWIRGIRILGEQDGIAEKSLGRRVRRNIRNLNDEEIDSLRRGVQTMKDRPSDDPTSWQFQANIHGTFTANGPLFNQCQHGTDHFLTWHRLYLYHFERILAEASGDPDLTLPYWDWTEDRALPIVFRQPADATNSLFDNTRFINQGALLPSVIVEDDLQSAMQRTSFLGFFGFSSRLEGSPHGAVHVQIGGNMASVPNAANDPIFWLHHCNIDRLWDEWLHSGDGRVNPNQSAFLNQQYSFASAGGTVVTNRVGDHLYSSQLGYAYDTTPPPSIPIDAAAILAMTAGAAMHDHADHESVGNEGDPLEKGYQMVASSRTANEINIDAAPPETTAMTLSLQPHRVKLTTAADAELPFESISPAGDAVDEVVIQIRGIEFDNAPGFTYAAYLNLPEDVADPERTSLYRLGTLSLFGVPKQRPEGSDPVAHSDHPLSQSFDATKTVARLKNLGLWSAEKIEITLLPVTPSPPPDAAEQYGRRLRESAERAKVRYSEIRLLRKDGRSQ